MHLVRPQNSTEPLGCIAAGTRSSTITPRPSNAKRIRDAVGRPPGEPTARWTVAAANSPAAIAATSPAGVVAPRNSAAVNCPAMFHRPKCRNGRLRCGDAVQITAVAMASGPGGNTGGPSTSANRPSTSHGSPVTMAAPMVAYGDRNDRAGQQITAQRRSTTYERQDDQEQRPDHRCPEQQLPERIEEPGKSGEHAREGLLQQDLGLSVASTEMMMNSNTLVIARAMSVGRRARCSA